MNYELQALQRNQVANQGASINDVNLAYPQQQTYGDPNNPQQQQTYG